MCEVADSCGWGSSRDAVIVYFFEKWDMVITAVIKGEQEMVLWA